MAKQTITYGEIDIPHLAYRVSVRRFKQAPPELPKECSAYFQKIAHDHSAIYLKPGASPPAVAHECIHVLQHLCDQKYMLFEGEKEHMAYLMDYLMCRILGWRFKTTWRRHAQ